MDYSLPGSSVRGIPRQGYRSGLPFPTPGDLPTPGMESTSLMSPALAGVSLILVPLTEKAMATSLSLFTFMHWRRKWQPTPVFLPGESQGWGSLVGCRLGGAQSRTRLNRLSSSSSSATQVKIHYFFQIYVAILEYSWPLNNKDLNFTGLLFICEFLSMNAVLEFLFYIF